jgi:hypothetical protein
MAMPDVAIVMGFLTFGAPALLWGGLAAAAPIVIHLLLRPRPRSQPFPALRFVVASQQASERTQRLRRILLLAMRALALVGIAALLAQPRLSGVRWLPAEAGPASAVICIDDSASMSYRYQGRTRLEAAKAWARALIEDKRRFGEGSEFAVISGGAPAAGTALVSDRGLALRDIERIGPTAHGRPVEPMVRRADEVLVEATHPRREIYVIHDGTARAWRDPGMAEGAMRSGASVYCVDVGANEDRNASVVLTSVPERPVVANAPVRVEATVRTGADWIGSAGSTLEARVDGEVVARVPVASDGGEALGPAGEAALSVVLPGMRPGVRTVTLTLQPADVLAWDNQRYVCVDVGSLPKVALVETEAADVDATLIAEMLAPGALPADRQRMTVTRIAADRAEGVDWSQYRCVFLVDVAELNVPTWRGLTGYVEAGGDVVVVLGPSVRPTGYAAGANVLPGLPVEVRTHEPPARLVLADTTHELLERFRRDHVDSLGDRLILRSWRVEPADESVAVLCPLSTGEPGLLERRVGLGRCVLIPFAPRREWSEFGSRAAPLILLLHRLVERTAAAALRVDQAVVDETVRARIGADAGTTLQLARVAEGVTKWSRPIDGNHAQGQVAIPTDSPGEVLIRAGEAVVYGCAVNVAAEESDLRRIEAESIVGRFPAGVARVVESPEGFESVARARRAGLDLTVPLAVLLLGWLIAESAFANRFYKRIPQRAAGADRR